MKYGIELEFFVKKDGNSVPAFLATKNLDGNPAVGEIRTSPHDNIVDCIFDLKKKLYLEVKKLSKDGFTMDLSSRLTVDNDFLRQLRMNQVYIDAKRIEILKEISVYPNGRLSTPLLPNVFIASLQVNLSDNCSFSYPVYEKITVEDKFRYESKTEKRQFGAVFDYASIIFGLDKLFADEIRESRRTKGIYAIKSGEFGSRVEYRSLPNTVDLDKLLNSLA